METPKVIEGQMSIELGPITFQAQGDTRVNFSVPHLLSAAVLSRRVGELEEEYAGSEFGAFWHPVFANASGTIFAAVAALESYANELFIDHKSVFPELRVEVMQKLWELYEQKSILEKYELALLLKDGLAFDRGASPYQDVSAIVKLRNGLIHFKPEWFSAQEEHAKLSALLKHRATLSPFFPESEPLFPRGWTSHATVKWAIQSILTFVLDFEVRAKVEQRMAKFKEKFNAL